MSSVVIPVYCGLSGCWQIASVDGFDFQNHPFHACTHKHADKIKEYRAQVYAEGRLLGEFWKANWRNYVNCQKLG